MQKCAHNANKILENVQKCAHHANKILESVQTCAHCANKILESVQNCAHHRASDFVSVVRSRYYGRPDRTGVNIGPAISVHNRRFYLPP